MLEEQSNGHPAFHRCEFANSPYGPGSISPTLSIPGYVQNGSEADTPLARGMAESRNKPKQMHAPGLRRCRFVAGLEMLERCND